MKHLFLVPFAAVALSVGTVAQNCCDYTKNNTGPTPRSSSGTDGRVWREVPQDSNLAFAAGTRSLSLIVTDTKRTGFQFTDATKGQYVTFDILGNGQPLKLSWPKASSGNAWLAYDRDGDGIIKDGTELFGNFTPHSHFSHPDMPASDWNGFIALDWYDQPENGGTGDTILDKNDAIWKKLRLWIDTHCYTQPDTLCQSEPSELHTLESFGVTSISLEYQYDPQNFDKFGNRFEFWAVLNPELGAHPIDPHGHHIEDPNNEGASKRSQDGRRAYDVFLTSVP